MAAKPSSRQGRIGTATLPEVVRDLWRAQASGTLRLESGSETKKLAFKKGDIVFAATNVEAERLGERLIRDGRIKRSILDLAFRVMERSHQRLGMTMVEWGWVSPLEMRRAVATQIKNIIYSVFTWSSGEYRFDPADEPVPADLVLELRTAEVIYEGARRMSDLRAIRTGVGSPSGILFLAGGGHLGIPVTQEDGFILARVDGRASILDVVSGSPLGEEETLRRVYALLLAGVLVRQEAPTPSATKEPTRAPSEERTPSEDERRFRDGVVARHAAMKFGNFYDRLGVDSGASEKTIRDSYNEVVTSLEPAASFREQVGDLGKRLDDVRRRVTEAFETLVQPDRRRAYDRSISECSTDSTIAAETIASRTVAVPAKPKTTKKLGPTPEAKQEAELYYVEANRSWQSGDYFDAIASMNEAVRLDPEKPAYHRVLGRWLAENPSCAEAAREHFERAIALDPADREAHLGLAQLFETEGLTDEARGIYERLANEREPRKRISR